MDPMQGTVRAMLTVGPTRTSRCCWVVVRWAPSWWASYGGRPHRSRWARA